MTTQIAAAMEQQTAVSSEISKSVVSVREVSVNNAQGSELAIGSMKKLANSSSILLDIAHQFGESS